VKVATEPRAQELLVERALRPLDDSEHWELHQLGAEDDESFDLAAAGLAIAMTPIEPMPAELASRIWSSSPGFEAMRTIPGASLSDLAPPGAQGSGLLPGQLRTLPGVVPQRPGVQPISEPAPVVPQPQAPQAYVPERQPWIIEPPNEIEKARAAKAGKRSRFATVAPWIAAAACLALAIGTFLWSRDHGAPRVATAPTPAAAREQLLASASDVQTISWTTTSDPTVKGASGDVVWSQKAQRGYMRFVGMTPNDVKAFQYQLWIFDKNRDDKYPIDGGVFDVSSTGEVIVPIDAKISVDDATLFAVTVERPGGVVVSKRERIVVTAARKS
jgi:anti-sigma-K factor RskA